MTPLLNEFVHKLSTAFVEKHVIAPFTNIMTGILSIDPENDRDTEFAARILNLDESLIYEARYLTDWEAQARAYIENADIDGINDICERIEKLQPVGIDWCDEFAKTDNEKSLLKRIKNDIISRIKEYGISWKEVCNDNNFELDNDLNCEVLEYWLVDHLAMTYLEKCGEFVLHTNGLYVWCRTTSGQAICMDSCVENAAVAAYKHGFIPNNNVNVFDIVDSVIENFQP